MRERERKRIENENERGTERNKEEQGGTKETGKRKRKNRKNKEKEKRKPKKVALSLVESEHLSQRNDASLASIWAQRLGWAPVKVRWVPRSTQKKTWKILRKETKSCASCEKRVAGRTQAL